MKTFCVRHWQWPPYATALILEFGKGASNQAVASGITIPLYATDGNRSEQFYLAQPLPICATVFDKIPSNKNLHHSQGRNQTNNHPNF